MEMLRKEYNEEIENKLEIEIKMEILLTNKQNRNIKRIQF